MEKKKYPIGSENYVLYEVVGHGASASVYRATCIPLNETVAIKILDFERHGTDLSNLSREAQTMILVDHPNILKAYCTFVADHDLWVVMPFMAGGSFLHILKVSYEDGFEEVVIATILREALKGLEYLHQHGHIHRDVKAGNILVDAQGAIKLGDFGVAACIFDSGDRQRTRNTFVGTPCWMAPEVMQQLQGYDFKADIWSFGITALELAHGHAPFSKYPPMKIFLMTLQNAPPGLDYERDKKFSKSFKQMIASCLVKDPSKRPTVKKLLKHSFFKKARSNEYIVRNILEGLPSLGERLKKLKMKEEDMVKQKKISDGQKEELSQNNYKQSLSGWEFDVDYLKAQASLCQDEETLTEQGESSCSSLGQGSLYSSVSVDMQDTQSESQCQPSSISQNLKDVEDIEDDDVIQNRPAHPSFGNPKNSLQQHHDHIENVVIEKLEMEINDRLSEGMISHPSLQFGDSSGTNVLDTVFAKEESQKQQRHHQNMVNSDGTTGQHVVGDALSDTLSIASKASGMGDDSDEKTRAPVVQQRGRFKVTSENLDLEKVTPSPMLQKSHSIQVISQLPVSSPKPSSAARSLNPPGCSLHQQLESALQSNILQREALLSVQKQVPFGGSTVNCDGGHMLTITTLTENSLPEAACDREKELLKEMTEVQQRLIRIQDELLTLKDKKCPGVNVMKCSPR